MSQTYISPNPFSAEVTTPPKAYRALRHPAVTPCRPRDEAWLKDELPRPLAMQIEAADKKTLERNTGSFATKQVKATPLAPKFSKKDQVDPKRDDQKEMIEIELTSVIGLGDNGVSWAESLYIDLVDTADIDDFLARTKVYNTKAHRWVTLPRSAKKLDENKLYKPYVEIINLILRWFVLKDCKEGGILREAIDTHVKNLAHQEEYVTIRWSRPDVSVRAEGPYFQVPESKGKINIQVGFSNMSSFMEMKVENRKVSVKDQLLQVGIYVRQIFIQQPNRQFVRVLLLTEKGVRLFHFDRSGVLYTPFIDIHKDPHTFVRLVAGLNSLHEPVLGFDTSIKWKIEEGRKVDGTLTTWRADNRPITYQLCDVDPVVAFRDICGQATQCWSVSDPETGVRYLVKDCWKAVDRISEHIHLKDAQGLPGVVQMVSFEPNRGETKDFREADSISHEDFLNRVSVRVILDSCGNSVENFKSARELLCAFRDAITGHMKLFGKDILHRDISMDTILLGRRAVNLEPRQGDCGLLSGLDMAIKVYRDTKDVSIEWRTPVSRTYLSIGVLSGCPVSPKSTPIPSSTTPAQDHLDDLESFLYIYGHLIYKYNEDGVEFEVPRQISRWKYESAEDGVLLKKVFLNDTGVIFPEISLRWPQECINVLHDFRAFISKQITLKKELSVEPLITRAERYKQLLARIATHYNTVLHLFNDAIESLEAKGPEANNNINTTVSSLTVVLPDPDSPTPQPKFAGKQRLIPQSCLLARAALKRAQEEYPEEVPEAKRGL
ncbi:hypothetical protein EST38_g13249 [Candolleomyces aberdarensis]|uniref:Fungal-type protein kinase domain-containing protein n=1 Tax=Candolleomyces aberdarensis TaxID=2316362 RepID=A0A4Q2D360_9AGAR|nr:hypothetical protein EST38_g13249 [Candolleomyces aberdarensis]